MDDLVATREDGLDVELPTGTPGTRRASASSSPGRRSAFDGMHAKKEHSPPTSRSSTIATETPFSPSRPAITSPGAPGPDHDHVELALAHVDLPVSDFGRTP